MSNQSKDIQAASSNTCPPILDRTHFESWQQRIQLYYKGKDHGEYILLSIDEDPFRMGRCRDEIAIGTDGPYLGPEQDRVVADLSQAEKERLRADICAMNILLQGSELTKDDCESQLYDEFEYYGNTRAKTFMTTTSDADHVGCLDTRKSTSRSIQFLDEKLVSWMLKEQDCTVMSTAEAEIGYQLADMFTKALPQDRFEYLVRRLAENSNLTQKIQKDDHDEMIKHFSKLEVEHLNLQLKYQHLKECLGNKKSVTSSDALAFKLVFVIGNLKEQLQGKGNIIRELKEKISHLQKKHSEADPILDFKALNSQNKDLNAKVNALQDLNERFRVENKKVKHHYKELPDPMKPKVLAPGMYAIDVEPIPP
nr:Gag-Pol polyprotein [Tanacetum cinerariifolium]